MSKLFGTAGGAAAGSVAGNAILPGVGGTVGGVLGGAAGSSLTGGGSSTTGQTTATTPSTGQIYTPQAQSGADISYTGLLNDLLALYQTNTLPSQTGYSQIADEVTQLSGLQGQGYDLTQNILTNPYYGQQQTGANQAADFAANTIGSLQNVYDIALNSGVSGMTGAAGTLGDIATTQQGYADTTAGYAPTLTGYSSQAAKGIEPTQTLAKTTSDLITPTTTLASDVGKTVPQYQTYADKLYASYPTSQTYTTGIASNIQPVTDYSKKVGGYMDTSLEGQSDLLTGARSLLDTGYDPRSAKYNQLTQQTRDYSNALNAMSGLGGTPYAAGLTNDALRKMNIDWQDDQLARQKDALAGAGTALGTRSDLYTAAGKLGDIAIGGYGTAADIGTSALGGLETGGKLLTSTGDLVTAGGKQAGTAADIYGTAGTLGTQAGGLYGTAADTAKTAGDLTLGAGTLQTEAGKLADYGRLATTDQAKVYAELPTVADASTTGLTNLGTAQTTAAGLPATTYTGQQTTGTKALSDQQGLTTTTIAGVNDQINAGELSIKDANSLLTDYLNYLNLGQTASKTSVSGTYASNQSDAANLSGVSTLGTTIGGGLNTSTSGTTGTVGSALNKSLGIPEGGLFGSLFGSDTSSPTEFMIPGTDTGIGSSGLA